MHTKIRKSERAQQPTQQINPAFAFQLSLVKEQPGRFGMLIPSGCFTVAKASDSQCHAGWVSLLVASQNSWVIHFSASQYARSSVVPWPHYQGGRTFMKHSSCRYLFSTKRSLFLSELICSPSAGWAGSQLTNTPHICAAKIHTCIHFSLQRAFNSDCIPSTLQYMIIENPH